MGEIVHAGTPRKYFCRTWLTEDRRKFVPEVERIRQAMPFNDCMPTWVQEGMAVPTCYHGPMITRTVRSKQEREIEARLRSKFRLYLTNVVHVWPEECKKRSRCMLCDNYIYKGEERVVFAYTSTSASPYSRFHGRKFVHLTCIFDVLGGGRAGQGCPGCTAKRDLEEFRAYRKMVAKSHAEG